MRTAAKAFGRPGSWAAGVAPQRLAELEASCAGVEARIAELELTLEDTENELLPAHAPSLEAADAELYRAGITKGHA